MTSFPDIPLAVTAELQLNGTWTDVTHYLDQGPISISRGHPDESTTVSPSTLAMTLTNGDNRFSANNVTGPYYPYLLQNVPCRVSVPAAANYLRLEQDNNDRAFVNEVAALDITGDIEMRIQLRLTDWSGGVLAAKWDGGNCWAWLLNPDGTMTFRWSDGVQHFVTSSLPLTPSLLTMALRVTMAVATGTVTFYTSGTIGGTYAQLGAAASGTGGTTTSIITAGGSALAVGWSQSFAPNHLRGQVDEYRLYNGIAGSIVADGVFSGQAAGTTTWTDSAGRTWLLSGLGEISGRDYRAHVEVAEFPQDQPPADPDTGVIPALETPVAGGGLLRRLSQRGNPARSTMYRAWTLTGASLAAYWPMEDGPGAQSLASGIGGQPMYYSGSPQLAANSDFACSGPLPVANDATFAGNVPPYSGTWSGNQVSWLMEVPAAGEFNSAEIVKFSTSGTIASVVVHYGTGGTMAPVFYAGDGTILSAPGAIAFLVNGQQLLAWLSLAPDGSGGINWEIATVVPDATTASAATGNIGSATIGAVTRVGFDGSGQLTGTVFGHCAVQAAAGDLTPLGGPLNSWILETAGNRIQRVCAEEGIPFRSRGILANTAVMGPQASQTVTQLIQEAADADRGVWFECRQVLGWGYVPRMALYNQAVAVALDYAQDQLSEWPAHPMRDDQVIANDVTVSQTSGGSTARSIAAPGNAVTGGRLAALAPPAGVGVYDGGGASLNLGLAADLPSVATWMTHVGTVDEHRLPGIAVDLGNRGLGATLSAAVAALELGQRLTIANPPGYLGADTVSQLAAQLAEEVFSDVHVITVCGIPSSPYHVAQEGATTAHADTDGSVLAVPVTSGATTLLVVVTGPSGILWTTSGGDLPFDVNLTGERVTVTAIGAVTVTSVAVADGTFESGVSQWAATGGSVAQVAHPHTGSFAAALTVSGSPSQATLRPVNPADLAPVIPGEFYTAPMWLRTSSGTATAQPFIDWRRADHSLISTSSGSSGTATTTYAQFIASGTAPAGAALAGYGPTMPGSPANGTILWIDDVDLQASAQAFTVTRSVNTVVKAHPAGEPLALWDSPVAAL